MTLSTWWEGVKTRSKEPVAINETFSTSIGTGNVGALKPVATKALDVAKNLLFGTTKKAVVTSSVGIATTGYIAGSEDKVQATKEIAGIIPKTTEAIFDLGKTVSTAKDTKSIQPIIDFGKEHPIFSGGAVILSTAGGIKLASNVYSAYQANQLRDELSKGVSGIGSGMQDTSKYDLKIAQEQAETQLDLMKLQIAQSKEESENALDLAKLQAKTQLQLAELQYKTQALSSPVALPVVAPTTTATATAKKKTTKKKTTKKKTTKKKTTHKYKSRKKVNGKWVYKY